MTKRFGKFKLIAILALILVTAVACSPEKPASDGDKGEGQEEVIQIFIPGYEDETWKGLYDKGIKDFETDNPGVKVDVVPAGWDEVNSKIVGLIQANEAPDVMITGSRSLRQFAELGAIEPLDQFITEDFLEKRVENVLATGNIKDVQYGIPLAFSSRGLYYRTDLIDTPPTTWDELYDMALDIKKNNPDMYGFAIPTDITSGTDELLNFIYQNEGSVVDEEGNIKLASPENIETMEFLKKFNDEKIVPDAVSTARSDQAQLFQNGDLAMFISGPWERGTLDENKDEIPYDVALLPEGKRKAETLVTDSYSISAQSKNKDLAWKLIEHMGQFEYQNNYDESIGFFPILKEEEKEARYQEGFLKPFGDMIQYGEALPHVPMWDTFNSEFINAVQRIMTGDATAEEALKDAEKELAQ